MLTTILAYVIAAVGLATIQAGAWSFVMLAIQDERDRPFRHYAIAVAMLAGGFAMVGPAQVYLEGDKGSVGKEIMAGQ
jgi:hypothetical protein